jgi:hypothetical protein
MILVYDTTSTMHSIIKYYHILYFVKPQCKFMDMMYCLLNFLVLHVMIWYILRYYFHLSLYLLITVPYKIFIYVRHMISLMILSL